MAKAFDAALKNPGGPIRPELARRSESQRPRVTQSLCLMYLHPLIREFMMTLGDDVPERAVTERELRALIGKRQDHQVRAAVRTLPGFERFLAHVSRGAGRIGTPEFLGEVESKPLRPGRERGT